MKKSHVFSIAAVLALALVTAASPAAAYVIEALTSIPVDRTQDKAALEGAILAAVRDVATRAVAFTPTVVSIREARLIGDRIYLFVLLTDAAGEQELELLKTNTKSPDLETR
jgi:hypothetical protein